MILKPILLTLLLSLTLCSENVVYIESPSGSTPEELIDEFAGQQGEIHRKVFTHYINE